LNRGVLVAVVVIVVVAAVAGWLAYYRASAGQRLVVVTYNDIKPVIQLAAEEFEASHPGVKVVVVSFPWDSYINNELTVLEAKSPQYDVVTFTPTSSQLVAPYLVPS